MKNSTICRWKKNAHLLAPFLVQFVRCFSPDFRTGSFFYVRTDFQINFWLLTYSVFVGVLRGKYFAPVLAVKLFLFVLIHWHFFTERFWIQVGVGDLDFKWVIMAILFYWLRLAGIEGIISSWCFKIDSFKKQS